MPRRAAPRRRTVRNWASLGDDELLDLRFCDLRLRIPQTDLQQDIEHLHASLERRGITFRPHVWLSTEWFSPDGIPGIAVPFFAAHPRLRRLETRMAGEAEGGNRTWRRRILAHEAGHALDTAFSLRRLASWRKVFGPASKPYPHDYSVRPGSRRFVLHLGHWYAQSHPTEDFAETFAVWLQPRARWRREYAGWPALRKLEYVDALMGAVSGRKPRNRDRSVVLPLAHNQQTLRTHYRRRYQPTVPSERRYDAWLRDSFNSRASNPDGQAVAAFMAARRDMLRKRLMRSTEAGRYLVDHVIEIILRRLRKLDLRTSGGQRTTERELRELLEAVIEDILQRNREKYVL